MAWSGVFSRFKVGRTSSWLDRGLYSFAVYAVPALLALGTLATLWMFPHEFKVKDSQRVAFRVLNDRTATLTPERALQALADKTPATQFSTKLAETPIWFTMTAPANDGSRPMVLEFPSRHAQTLACWQASNLLPLGHADRMSVAGELRAAKAGFILFTGNAPVPPSVLCRGTFSGPAQLTVLSWHIQEFRDDELDFQENHGLISGGLLTLAFFVFVTALINREWTYVIFSMWLVGNLRLSANAMGWDTEWLDRLIPAVDLSLLRRISFATYYIITGVLFTQLFRRELRVIGFQWLLRAAQYAGLLLLVCAFVLPYSKFIPALWGIGGVGISTLIFLLAQLTWKARTRTVMWYVASLAVVLFATLSEVVGALFGIAWLAAGISPVLSALTSSMMAALALAEQMRAERERRRAAQVQLRNAYEAMPIGMFALNSEGRFVRTNPALRSMLGMKGAEFDAHHWNEYFETGAWGLLQSLLLQKTEGEIEILGSAFRGTAGRTFLLKAISLNGGTEGSLQDVTERSKAVERLRFLADHDPLTGLLNRRGLEKAIEQQVTGSSTWTLAYVDLDRFKLINDLFGHRSGDEVLRQVAARIKAMLGEQHSFGRMGGDEFVYVMNGVPVEDATEHCLSVLSALNDAPYRVGSRAFQVKASIGLVECSPAMRVQDALSHADRACREAKTAAPARLIVYNKGAASFGERAEELRLVKSFGNDQLPDGLFLMMQPIMSMTAPTESLNFEVLLRMRAPDGTIIPPNKIIAAAEESGNVATIDKWVLSTTLKWVSENRDHLQNTQFICVNLSGGSLNDEHFTEDIFHLLEPYRAVLRYLCLEITETVALHDLENTQRFISRVHQMGAKIALDDFGAGYTSLSYLKSLSADALKIDGAFIQKMCGHPADIAIVEALVSLARNLGMRSVAEWVEDADTLHALSELGVDYVQGYAISRPQECHAIALAESSASFVTDPDVSAFIRQASAATMPADTTYNV